MKEKIIEILNSYKERPNVYSPPDHIPDRRFELVADEILELFEKELESAQNSEWTDNEYACNHDWYFWEGMLGPMRGCKKCGK